MVCQVTQNLLEFAGGNRHPNPPSLPLISIEVGGCGPQSKRERSCRNVAIVRERSGVTTVSSNLVSCGSVFQHFPALCQYARERSEFQISKRLSSVTEIQNVRFCPESTRYKDVEERAPPEYSPSDQLMKMINKTAGLSPVGLLNGTGRQSWNAGPWSCLNILYIPIFIPDGSHSPQFCNAKFWGIDMPTMTCVSVWRCKCGVNIRAVTEQDNSKRKSQPGYR
jgi:hypothetical protein